MKGYTRDTKWPWFGELFHWIIFLVALAFIALAAATLLTGCHEDHNNADRIQRAQQERMLEEATSETGMPAIHNFRERKMLKMIYELRDQADYVTYTYIVGEYDAKLVFFCQSIGYGIPYATQYTNPERPDYEDHYGITLPQADPNGLFSPASAEGTWVLCKDPHSDDVKPVYVEPRLVVSPFPMDANEAAKARAP